MSNGIPSFDHNRINLYRQTQQNSEIQSRKSGPVEHQAHKQQPVRQTQSPDHGKDLTEAEQLLIDQYFPPSPQMNLRLYGPGKSTKTINPNAVGSRLDLRG